MSDCNNYIPEIYEDFEKFSETLKSEYQEILELVTFNQSLFSEENFVINSQITPHRKLRQALIHYDGKSHALAEARFGEKKAKVELETCEKHLKILDKLKIKIELCKNKPKKLPSYSFKTSKDTTKILDFNPNQILDIYEDNEWEEAKEMLLDEINSFIELKNTEIASINRSLFQQIKLKKDSQEYIEFYKKEIPRLIEQVRESGMSFEKSEEMYWKLRFEREFECDKIAQQLGTPSKGDFIQSISELPESIGSSVIEQIKENNKLIESNGVTGDFVFKRRISDFNKSLGLEDNKLKLEYQKHNSQRKNKGNILVGLLYRTEEDVKKGGMSNPQENLLHPTGYNVEFLSVYGMRTDDARNKICQVALNSDVDWVLFIDDDMIIPETTLIDLISTEEKIIGAEYPLKKDRYQSAHVLLNENGEKIEINLSDKIINCNGIIASGCLLINIEVIKNIGIDWFKEYHNEKDGSLLRSDDYQFTQRSLELGYTPKINTDVRCLHVDMDRRKIYGERYKNNKYCSNSKFSSYLRIDKESKPISRIALACPRRNENDIPITNYQEFNMPKGFEIAQQVISPTNMTVSDAYNHIIKVCLDKENCVDVVFIYETDMIIPKNTLSKLLSRIINDNLDFVCASYVLKDGTDQCTAFIKDISGVSKPLPDPFTPRGLVECNWIAPMGCCAIKTDVFREIEYPWFAEVNASPNNPVIINEGDNQIEIKSYISQDAYFSEKLFRHGFKAFVDTDIQCLHVNKDTEKIYGSPKIISDNKIIGDNYLEEFAIKKQ